MVSLFPEVGHENLRHNIEFSLQENLPVT